MHIINHRTPQVIIIAKLVNMKNQQEIKIASLDFNVTPIHLTLKGTETHSYFVQFDKGAQILKKFDEEIIITPTKPVFRFRGGEVGKFKLLSERGCNCEWGLYRISSNEMSQFTDSLPINLLEYFNSYTSSLKPFQQEYLKILAEKVQGKEVSKSWSALKQSLAMSFPSIIVKNKGGSIEICFNLEIRCEVDAWCDVERQKPVKSARNLSAEKQIPSNVKSEVEEDELLPKNSVIPDPVQKEEEQYTINHPLPKIQDESLFKRGSVLSDIMECSENSSNLNYGDKKGSLKEISGIPEEQAEIYSPNSSLVNTKTQNFEAIVDNNEGDHIKRRCNTFDSKHNEFLEYPIQLRDSKKFSTPERDINVDEELGKEELIAAMQTIPQSEIVEPKQQVVSQSNSKMKWLAVILIILIYCGASYASMKLGQTKQSKRAERSRPEPSKKVKGKKSKQI